MLHGTWARNEGSCLHPLSEMSINQLARDFTAAQKEADSLDIGDLGWEEAWVKEMRLAAKIRSCLLDKPLVLSEDPAVTQIFKEIDLADFHDAYETGRALLYDLIRPEDYLAGLAEIILIVPVGTQIPEHLHSFFKEARQCYALGQYSAVQSLCRTIRESTVNDIGILTGEWTQKQLHTPPFRRGYPFNDRVKLVAGGASDEICKLYKDLCSVVHGAATSASCGAPGALTKTLCFVQYLYGRHKVQKE